MSDRLALIFAGQGAQHPGMGRVLYEESAAARAVYDQADGILGWPLRKLCFEGTEADLTACAHCQPAIFVTSMAAVAARLSGSDGRIGDENGSAVVCGGLSLGEWAAFTAAGALDFEAGLRAVAERGRLMDEACHRHPGGMAAVIGVDEERVAAVCAGCGAVIANYNCEGQLIISGEKSALEQAVASLAPEALKCVPLEVAGAYHSPLMREAAVAFGEYLAGVEIRKPAIPVVHNVTGAPADNDPAAIRARLVEQIYSPVRWDKCAGYMAGQSDRMIEVGPGHVLAGLMKRIVRRFPVVSMDL